jgi:hypothetical protein
MRKEFQKTFLLLLFLIFALTFFQLKAKNKTLKLKYTKPTSRNKITISDEYRSHTSKQYRYGLKKMIITV